MQQQKVKINLSGISKTLLFPLMGRVRLSEEHSSLINDVKAIEIIEKIDYDFSSSYGIYPFERYPPFPFALRAKHFDDKIKAYISKNPQASIVNIGAGLDTTFYRVDNGLIQWYDLDLPEVIELRKKLIPKTNRATCIAKSFLDPSWYAEIKSKDDGLFIVLGGVLMYFEELQVKKFLSSLADNLPGTEIIFDAPSKLVNHIEAWIAQFEPYEQRAFKGALKAALKNWWQNEPQDAKEKLMVTLTTNSKPRSTQWSDLEAWWKQLSDLEKEDAWRDIRLVFSDWNLRKWALKDAHEIKKWDTRIEIIDQFPLFRNIPRDPSLSITVRRFMDFSERYRLTNIFHLKV